MSDSNITPEQHYYYRELADAGMKQNRRTAVSDWISEDKWEKKDLKPVWVYLSWITDLGLTHIQDKAYWSELNQQWHGYGYRDPISQGAQVRYVMPLPEPPKEKRSE